MPRRKPDVRRAQKPKGRARRPRPWRLLPPAPVGRLEQLAKPEEREWAA